MVRRVAGLLLAVGAVAAAGFFLFGGSGSEAGQALTADQAFCAELGDLRAWNPSELPDGRFAAGPYTEEWLAAVEPLVEDAPEDVAELLEIDIALAHWFQLELAKLGGDSRRLPTRVVDALESPINASSAVALDQWVDETCRGTVAASAGDDGADLLDPAALEPYCDARRSLAGVTDPYSLDGAAPIDVKRAIDAGLAAWIDVEDVAPALLEADIALLADEMRMAYERVAGNGYDPSRGAYDGVLTLELVAIFDAEARLELFDAAHC